MALWFDKLDFLEKVAGLSHSGRPLKHQKLAFDKQIWIFGVFFNDIYSLVVCYSLRT